MVSLGGHFNTSGSGAVFFDNSMNMDEEEYLQPVLVSQEHEEFQKLDTIPIVAVPLLFGAIIEIAGIIFMTLWSEEKNKCDFYFILLYLHCVFWFLIMLADHLVKSKHHELRICGYLDFYQSTYQHIRTPLFIVSLWNTTFLLLAIILHHTHKQNYEEYCQASQWFAPLNYTLLLTTLELAIIFSVYANYIKRVLKFNRTKPPPDVMKEEWMTDFTQNSYSGEVGFHQRGFNYSVLLEKQADLIRYLRDHNVKLSHRMMVLMSSRRNP